MSVRAHRVIKVEYAPETSFNLSHDEKLVSLLDGWDGIWCNLNDDGCGQVSISVDSLRAALGRATELELDPETIEAITDDIAFAVKVEGEDYVTYDFF